MDKVRAKTLKSIKEMQEKINFLSRKRIAVILPATGFSGGANSICQEIIGLKNLGLNVTIINKLLNKESFEKSHPECNKITIYYKKTPIEYSFNFDVIICSIFYTVEFAEQMQSINPDLKIAYYVQDYEPYFFQPDNPNYQKAIDSYELIPNAMLFAKTDWILNTVKAFHPSVNIQRVKPSIKWSLYNPYLIKDIDISYPINIVCMVRPQTIRRNPTQTLEVMNKLSEKYKDKIIIHTFGCTDKTMLEFSPLFNNYMINHGVLTSSEVAKLLKNCNIFLDMSTYQAFGRTGIEAMSLGCTAVLPKKGGATEYAINNKNSIIIDTQNVQCAVDEISKLIDNPNKLKNLCINALNTAKCYDVFTAAYSEIEVFYNWLKNSATKNE